MQLSKNFTLEEMTRSNTATSRGIFNDPAEHTVALLQDLVDHVLQPIRNCFKHGVVITSGYRSPELNSVIGGSINSDHMYGKAADIRSTVLSPIDLAHLILNNIPEFKQLILEFPDPDDNSKGWVHVSYDKYNNKKQVLTATKKDGRTRYLPGLLF